MSEAVLGRWPVNVALPILWGDMDELGHVNNVVYLKWFEHARAEYFYAAGLWQRDAVKTASVGPILARTSIDYRLALAYPDEVRVGCTVLKLGRTSFTMGLRLRSRKNDRAIAAEGEAVMVMLDYASGRKVELDAALRARIEALEASAAEPGSPAADA